MLHPGAINSGANYARVCCVALISHVDAPTELLTSLMSKLALPSVVQDFHPGILNSNPLLGLGPMPVEVNEKVSQLADLFVWHYDSITDLLFKCSSNNVYCYHKRDCFHISEKVYLMLLDYFLRLIQTALYHSINCSQVWPRVGTAIPVWMAYLEPWS